MRQPDDYCQADEDMWRRTNEINSIEDEVQCMESCLAQGFTLQDYIETQKQLIDKLIGLNNKL